MELKPHSKICTECKFEFSVEIEDIAFLKMLRVPPPSLCPTCRSQRRLSFANYSSIYKRKCNVPGHEDIMISPVAPVMPWVTYDHETYYSDAWSPYSYGLNTSTEQSFFGQFLNLLKVVPQPGVRKGPDSINSDYGFYVQSVKDCYYVFGGKHLENVMFSSAIYDSRNIIDSFLVRDVDTGYDNVSLNESFKCVNCYFSSNCIDSKFMYDCRNCSDCFGCVNLRNKKYCYFNEQYSKEEYFKKVNEIDLGSRKVYLDFKEKFFEFIKRNPVRAVRIQNSENVSGNDIKNSKNCHNVFGVKGGQNLRYANFIIVDLKDSMDVSHSGFGVNYYETQNVTSSSDVKFSFSCKEIVNGEYLITCTNCINCFGCIGLKNASYCIFNKQYSEEEYFEKLDEIKTKMLTNGEYGEFFPMSFSPVAYNSSFANIVYPMNEEDALSRSIFWQSENNINTGNLKAIRASDLPDNISDANKDLCDFAVIGKISEKPFRLTEREIDFYVRNKIALPIDTPQKRMLERFKLFNDFKVRKEYCDLCKKETLSNYRKSDGYILYCDSCYKANFS